MVDLTIHYHGTPISPRSVLRTLGGKNFCVSFADERDTEVCHEIGQSVMLDNGAYTFWKAGKGSSWDAFYRWAEKWLEYPTTWAVIPDVIEGGIRENSALLEEWPFGIRGAPVWHVHEPIDRLLELCQKWPKVCFGSSGQFSEVGSEKWRRKVDSAFNAIVKRGPIPWIHMLRGMKMAGSEYPFSSVDSADVARNHNRPGNTARKMADRWDSLQCPPSWKHREQMVLFE